MEEQEAITENEESSILYGKDAWVAYLSDKALPVRASSLKRLRYLLSQNSTMISHLSALVKTDPVLCLHVVRAAEQLHAGKDSHITSVEHAVSSLGIDPLIKLSRTLQPIKLNPSSVQQKQYMRAVANSHHAAYQAKHWLQIKNLPFVEEVYLASLFYSLPLWSLWLHAPLHMHEIQIKIWENKVDPTLAEHDVLGCTMQEIALGLSQTWGLSELTQQAQDKETSPSRVMLEKLHRRALNDSELSAQELRELNHLTLARYFPIKLANWLSLIVSRGWKSTRHINTTDIIADYLGMSIDNTHALIYKLCADSSREYHAPGTLSPASEMLMIPSDFVSNYKLSNKEFELLKAQFPAIERPKPKLKKAPVTKAVETEKPTHLPDVLADTNIYNQLAERFIKGYHLFTKPVHILQGLIQGLHQGLGLQRVVLNLINTRNHKMKAAQVVGMEKDHPFASYEIDLQIPSLFKRLCEKPACVWITAENRDQYLKELPDDYQVLLSEQDCLLMSIFRQDGAVAIIYADSGEEGLALHKFHHERFRYICSAATLALKRMQK